MINNEFKKYGRVAPAPPYEKSDFIYDFRITWTKRSAVGDMWPNTWGDDGNLYCGAGDNKPSDEHDFSPMNFWKSEGSDEKLQIDLVNNLPVDPDVYCLGENVHMKYGVKPAGLICLDGVLYMSVQNINYGDNPEFNRQHNLNGWIISSNDYGKTWNVNETPQNFFTGRVSSCHFLQAGKGKNCIKDGYVWAYFPCGFDGNDSWWCNGDGMLLGRVLPESLLLRDAWEFYIETDISGKMVFNTDYLKAIPVFKYDKFTGENHVSYNPYIDRYFIANYAFYNPDNGLPRPYHNEPHREYITQMTVYEGKNIWGPWKLIYRDDNWLNGGYQPSFPVCWMSPDGCGMTLLASGNNNDYCFLTQGIEYKINYER